MKLVTFSSIVIGLSIQSRIICSVVYGLPREKLPPWNLCLSVCVQDYSKTRAWIWMKCCMSTDVGTWTNWLTLEPDPDYSPDAGTGFLPPISYRLRNFAALPSLACFAANLVYFSAILVSICAKLACSILMTDRNTATEPSFRKKAF